VEVLVDTLHILQSDLLPKHHLVEGANEERIEEPAVENGESDHTTDELEIIQMLGVDAGMRVYLEGIIIVR
jgi:hypothetical protein